MDQLAGLISKITQQRWEEDFVDRLNYQLTGWLLLVFSITLSAKEYVGAPVQCWVPAQFKDGWEQYVEDYCFVENTYYLPFSQNIPDEHGEREGRMLNYYQWVPFVLALMALMFLIPSFVWRSINFLSGLSVRSVISMAAGATTSDNKSIVETVSLTAAHMREAMKVQESLSSSANPLTFLISLTTGHGWYIIISYIFCKLLFIGNIIAQFFILQSFLGSGASFWGATVLDDLVNNQAWDTSNHTSGAFPRVTVCDFDVRVLGNIQRFSVQCVLMINMFNEKIFIFLWWWFFFVAVLTVLSALFWFAVCFIPKLRRGFIVKMLNVNGYPKDHNMAKVNDFISNYVRPDGAFVLRLMSGNAGEVITSRVVSKMWENYLAEEQKPRRGFNNIGSFGGTETYPPLLSADELDGSKPTPL